MAKIIYISGGARSGKSSYAQQLAVQMSTGPVYLATARIWDDDFRNRVARHKSDRSEKWETMEEEVKLSKLELGGKTVLLDCITLWLTNIFYDHSYDLDKTLELAKAEWNAFIQQDFMLIVVSNELGMSIHPEHETSRKFVDLQGWMNQYIAKTADEAYLMVSGIPMKLK